MSRQSFGQLGTHSFTSLQRFWTKLQTPWQNFQAKLRTAWHTQLSSESKFLLKASTAWQNFQAKCWTAWHTKGRLDSTFLLKASDSLAKFPGKASDSFAHTALLCLASKFPDKALDRLAHTTQLRLYISDQSFGQLGNISRQSFGQRGTRNSSHIPNFCPKLRTAWLNFRAKLRPGTAWHTQLSSDSAKLSQALL